MLQTLLEASQVHESQELTQNGSNSSTCLLLCSFSGHGGGKVHFPVWILSLEQRVRNGVE